MFEKKYRVDELFIARVSEYLGDNLDGKWFIVKKLYDEHGHQYGYRITTDEVINYYNSLNQIKENEGCLMIYFEESLVNYVDKKKVGISFLKNLEEDMNREKEKNSGLRM